MNGKSQSSIRSNKTVKYIKKPAIKTLNSSNAYYPLVPADALYPQNLHLLKHSDYHYIYHKITADITCLLAMDTDQFYQELSNNPTLSLCLESCLSTLPRRKYSRLYRGNSSKSETIQLSDKSFQEYCLLVKNVLLVYHRISCAPVKYRQIIYSDWLLDIPKLLDLAAIYGQSNPQIVRKIIGSMYQYFQMYDEDTIDFFSLVSTGKLKQMEMEQDCVVDFSPKSLANSNFGNRQNFLVIEAVKLIFQIKDILLNLSNFMLYFPKKYAHELASDYKIQERLVNGVTIFLKQSSEDWKLGKYAFLFQNHLQDIRQQMAAYFIMQFNFLKQIMQDGQSSQFHANAEDTYVTFCMLLAIKNNQKPHLKYYQKLINTLIEDTQSPIFFYQSQKIKNLKINQRQSIDRCIHYEKVYREQKRKKYMEMDKSDEVYSQFKKGLQKFKDIEDQIQFQSISKNKQKQQIKMEGNKDSFHSQILTMKYKFNKQYDDDPQEQDQFARVCLQNEYEPIKPKQDPNLSFRMKGKSMKGVIDESINLSICMKNNGGQDIDLSYSQLGPRDISSVNMSSISSKNNSNLDQKDQDLSTFLKDLNNNLENILQQHFSDDSKPTVEQQPFKKKKKKNYIKKEDKEIKEIGNDISILVKSSSNLNSMNLDLDITDEISIIGKNQEWNIQQQQFVWKQECDENYNNLTIQY